ncbi:DNA adenine methylase [Longimicrobium sp.]|uniref:DNA adenine methylase n=1 Tax=Longimicrobium sp. TaxID=2029185 RepID=UPI002B5ADCC5|nr:DNA adenine methylase [Longimicrobium sp.]HSU16949.1 DNA adenine methylase [Longimicrobium sp.]
MDLSLDLGADSAIVPLEAPPRTQRYPRLRYMGSKYRVVPHLAGIFSDLRFDRALDAFSGSGVVAYALKEMGKEVVANDFLTFPSTVARAVVENGSTLLDRHDVEYLLSPNEDGRDFIARTFAGLYFPSEDHAFLDAAWSHVDRLPAYQRDLAIAAMCLAAARKQPRGVFTITDFRYDDGRRNLRTPLRELFVEAVRDLNRAVFDNGRDNRVSCGDALSLDPDGFDLVYFDPPYAPPRDDSDYIKRYHFLEGLSVYWRGLKIMEETATKKIEKRFTPFAYKRTIRHALAELFHRFRNSTIVLSYSSNSVPGQQEVYEALAAEKEHVDVHTIPHRYSFGTHAAAQRRVVDEYIFVGR